MDKRDNSYRIELLLESYLFFNHIHVLHYQRQTLLNYGKILCSFWDFMQCVVLWPLDLNFFQQTNISLLTMGEGGINILQTSLVKRVIVLKTWPNCSFSNDGRILYSLCCILVVFVFVFLITRPFHSFIQKKCWPRPLIYIS